MTGADASGGATPAPLGSAQRAGSGNPFEIAVDGLIGAYDLSPDAALRAHITQVLVRVGVEQVIVEPGAPFDPTVCEAVSTAPTEDPGQFQRVAETIRPGWRRPGDVLRSPQVAVWVRAVGPTSSSGGVLGGR